MKLKPDATKAWYSLVKSDLGAFALQAFATIYPGKEFDGNWHIEAILAGLESNLRGETPRLLFNIPPRSLKSFLISIVYPAFLLGIDPSMKIICISYSDELSTTIARDFRRVVESPCYRALFPDVRFVKSAANEMVTDRGGFRFATSVHGTLTGRGADLIIIDDPCRPEDVLSDRVRTAINEWFRNTVLSRRDDKLRAGIIVVMQRLHPNDLTGFLEESGGYKKIALPAIATKDEEISLRRGKTHTRCKGEALQPLRESEAVLKDLRRDLGAFNFEAQYQQSPRTPEGVYFKQKYFKVIADLPAGPRDGEYFISLDCAASLAANADYTAITIVYITRGELYVLHAERGRWDYEELKAKTLGWIRTVQKSNRPLNVVIENASSGISLYQFLMKTHAGKYRVVSRNSREDKVVRASRAMPWFERGIFIWNPTGTRSWIQPFLNEFMNFPNGANDDQVDSLVQILHWRYATSLLGKLRSLDD